MNALSLFITIVVIVSILALVTVIWIKFGLSGIESPERRAGRQGEKFAGGIIEEILDNTDELLRNVHITHNGEQTELDNVIINNAGVTVVEVKNWFGELFGEEDDPEWIQNKTSSGGGVIQQTVRNPILQVKRQVRILSEILADNSVTADVKGFVFFVNMNSPVESEYILTTQEDIDRAIHSKREKTLSDGEVEMVTGIIR